ncbi:MAG: hypothetical protein J1F38_00240 [Muribaculaceae bacterium]|nr:hypothetical protein [Muribaculaceae bacterium]
MTSAGIITDIFNKSFRRILSLAILSFFATAMMMSAPESDNPDDISSISYKAETRASFAGGENTPFWLVSNIHGLGSPEFNNGYVRGEVTKSLNESKKFDWGAGADISLGWNLPSVLGIRQLYADMHYKRLYVSLGSKNFDPTYNDMRLSSGDLLFSGNAIAIPQLRVGTLGFAPVWGTKGWFFIKAYLSYGKFTDSGWQKKWVVPGGERSQGVLFCGRGLWFRVGNVETFPMTVDLGIEMGTQFAGTVYKGGKPIRLAHGFIDWIKAFIPLSANSSAPIGEQTNVQGNMTGEYNFSINYAPNPNWNLKFYWDHYFEDHSQMFLEYGFWKDGLFGFEVEFPKNRYVDKLVVEYVKTTDQTGAVNNDYTPEVPHQVSGRDNYYNHYLYNCWQTWGMSIGTPLAISPLYNRNHILRIFNTRFKAFHIGFEGTPVKNLRYRMLLTFSQNWGTYWHPLSSRMDNCSGLVEIDYSPRFFKGFFAKASIAWDKGKLLGNNFGGMFTFGYEGNVKFKKK